MITPNIAPRKITGSAAAGLFSAAKSSIQRMERTTDAISKAPDVTKEQKFGINYVQFFGSKKNSKILKKSLKSIRDSLVATFEIAKLLRSEVSKNVKLIGEKTKKNKGFFGLGLGGLLSLASLLTNPIVIGALGIGGALVGGGFLLDYLKDNKDQIIEFVMDKAKGLYNTLQGFVANIIRDFLGDRFKDPETRNIEIESENNIDDEIKRLQKEDENLTKGKARLQATQTEITNLESKRDQLKNTSRSEAEDEELDAINKRIKQLKTGQGKFDRDLGFNPVANRLKKFFEGETQRQAVFLPENTPYLGMSDAKKFDAIKGLAGNFISKGNSLDRVREIYGRSLKEGEASTDPDKRAQALDLIEFARRKDSVTRKTEKEPNVNNFSFFDPKNIQPGSFSPITDKDILREMNLDKESSGTGGNMGAGTGGSGNINGKQSNLSQVPVEASSSPTCRYYSNFDGDNDLPGFNRSLLCIT